MQTHKKALAVKVGDVVRIDMSHYPENHPRRSFTAEVTEVIDRFHITPAIAYKRLDGVNEEEDVPPHCDVGFVSQIINPAKYIIATAKRVNIFEDRAWASRAVVRKQGGLYRGGFESLLTIALASVTRMNLEYPLEEFRARQMYTLAGEAGRVHWGFEEDVGDRLMFPGDITVRWKSFKQWAHRNAHRLIESRAETLARARKFQEELEDDYWQDVESAARKEFGWNSEPSHEEFERDNADDLAHELRERDEDFERMEREFGDDEIREDDERDNALRH